MRGIWSMSVTARGHPPGAAACQIPRVCEVKNVTNSFSGRGAPPAQILDTAARGVAVPIFGPQLRAARLGQSCRQVGAEAVGVGEAIGALLDRDRSLGVS